MCWKGSHGKVDNTYYEYVGKDHMEKFQEKKPVRVLREEYFGGILGIMTTGGICTVRQPMENIVRKRKRYL